uniref:Globin family profile domain-containing protein n=1 Tax=Onchocerca volvulus TaxID=6282 RepID=A0A8R1TTY2_ONCVO
MKRLIFSSETWYNFDDAEIQLLRRSWKTIKPEKQTVLQCPEVRRFFPFMNSDLKSCEKKNKRFVFQALRFIQVDMTIFNEIIISSFSNDIAILMLVFLECSIHQIRITLLNSKLDLWNRKDVDNVIILWWHLNSGICGKIKVQIIAT